MKLLDTILEPFLLNKKLREHLKDADVRARTLEERIMYGIAPTLNNLKERVVALEEKLVTK